MFYVSNITGTLTSYDPALTPISISTQLVSRTAPIDPTAHLLKEALAAEKTPIPVGITLLDKAVTGTTSPVSDDAAVFDGHVLPTNRDLSGIHDSTNIGRAGAIMAYQVQSGEVSADISKHEEISPIQSVDADHNIDQEHGKSAYRVTPINNYRRPTQDRHTAVIAADIMSSPVFTILSNTSLTEVKSIFREHKFRHIPIVSQTNKLVGIISDRDFFGRKSDLDAVIVGDLMVTNILTARPETEIRDIAEVMIGHEIGCLPILDEVGTIVGIVTRGDILRAIVNHAPVEMWT